MDDGVGSVQLTAVPSRKENVFQLLCVALKMDFLVFILRVCARMFGCVPHALAAHSSQRGFGPPGAAVTIISVCHHGARAANALSHGATSPAPCNAILKEKSLDFE